MKSRANSLQRRSASSFRIQVNLFSIVRKRDEAVAGCFFVDNRYRSYQIILHRVAAFCEQLSAPG